MINYLKRAFRDNALIEKQDNVIKSLRKELEVATQVIETLKNTSDEEIAELNKEMAIMDSINDSIARNLDRQIGSTKELLSKEVTNVTRELSETKELLNTMKISADSKVQALEDSHRKTLLKLRERNSDNVKLKKEIKILKSGTYASPVKEVIVRSIPLNTNDEILKRYRKFIKSKHSNGDILDHFEHMAMNYRFLPKIRSVVRTSGGYNRQEFEKSLPNSIDESSWDKILHDFDNKCSLSMSEDGVSYEHFIPISTGHGGSYEGNVVPLHLKLNMSKSGRNPFYWFSKNDFPVDFNISEWDKLISYLASKNNLTVEQYIHFVNWCFEFPRTLEQIKRDGNVHSIELWRSSLVLAA